MRKHRSMLREVVCPIISRGISSTCIFFAAFPERNFSYLMADPGEPGQKDVMLCSNK
jgi:hypothetical protein